ncbi:MAG: hypothetical protein MSS41_07470 [Collinsella sp.]|nr:hypothetical protein [Collinsella sp.]
MGASYFTRDSAPAGGLSLFGFELSWAVMIAGLIMILVGICAGFFVVPMNALLQHRGHVLMSAGRSIAVQNFNENSSILVMLGVYSLLIKADLSVPATMMIFGVFVSISNPCDVVCTELWHLTGYDPKKIIGSGCGLDSARLRTEISKKVGVSPKSIDAYMIGEHGFSQLAAFKAATIAGKSLNELQAENPDKYAFDHMEVEELARKGGYVTYAGKQCTEYAVANSAARVCAAVLHNEHAVLSASTLMTGQYGEEGIFTSLPCVIGAEGVEEVYTLDLSEHELEGFHKSCQHIRDNIAQLDWWDAEAYDAK